MSRRPLPPMRTFEFRFDTVTALEAYSAQAPEEFHAALTAYKLEVEEVLVQAKTELRLEASKVLATWRYSDIPWFRATQDLVDKLGRESRRVQGMLGQLGRKRHKEQEQSFCAVFVALSQTMLAPADYDRILNAAREACNPSKADTCLLISSGS